MVCRSSRNRRKGVELISEQLKMMRELVIEGIQGCEDVELLDLIHKMLILG